MLGRGTRPDAAGTVTLLIRLLDDDLDVDDPPWRHLHRSHENKFIEREASEGVSGLQRQLDESSPGQQDATVEHVVAQPRQSVGGKLPHHDGRPARSKLDLGVEKRIRRGIKPEGGQVRARERGLDEVALAFESIGGGIAEVAAAGRPQATDIGDTGDSGRRQPSVQVRHVTAALKRGNDLNRLSELLVAEFDVDAEAGMSADLNGHVESVACQLRDGRSHLQGVAKVVEPVFRTTTTGTCQTTAVGRAVDRDRCLGGG